MVQEEGNGSLAEAAATFAGLCDQDIGDKA